jgi:hypothetical protein
LARLVRKKRPRQRDWWKSFTDSLRLIGGKNTKVIDVQKRLMGRGEFRAKSEELRVKN